MLYQLLSFRLIVLLGAAAAVNVPQAQQAKPISFPLTLVQRHSNLPHSIRHRQSVNHGRRLLADIAKYKRDKLLGVRQASESESAPQPSSSPSIDPSNAPVYNGTSLSQPIPSPSNGYNASQLIPSSSSGPDYSFSSASQPSPIPTPLGGPDYNVSGSVVVGNNVTSNNSLPLDIDTTYQLYLITIYIGTPWYPYLMLVDTTTSDMWVQSASCQSKSGGSCGSHQYLGSTTSTSYFPVDTTWDVKYPTGIVTGTVAYDNVSIAGFQLPEHKFGVATNVEDYRFTSDYVPYDGVMGLGKSIGKYGFQASHQNALTVVESLASLVLIPAAITSYRLPRNPDELNEGQITFGTMDSSKYIAGTEETMDSLDILGKWSCVMNDIVVNKVPLGLVGRELVLDTTQAVIQMPLGDARVILRQFNGSLEYQDGQFSIPCTTNAVVEFSFKHQNFSINPQDLILYNTTSGNCISSIVGTNNSDPTTWIVGTVLLKNVYFSTNADNNTITLAKLA